MQETNPDIIHLYQTLQSGVEILYRHGVRFAVLSPGSRSAPLALCFMRHGGIKCYTLVDERSAAYTALGMAQGSNSPVVLVCTSGTAALNYAPAVAEAYWSNVPLLVLTADRPPEWTGQSDNQAIYQEGIYGKNCKASFALQADYSHKDARWHVLRVMNEAAMLAQSESKGPVHVNFPFREPFYPQGEVPKAEGEVPFIKLTKSQESPEVTLPSHVKSLEGKRVLYIAGQMPPWSDNELDLDIIEYCTDITFIGESISNCLFDASSRRFLEQFLQAAPREVLKKLQPDIVIYFGGPLISRRLKEWLRTLPSDVQFMRIGEEAHQSDPFQRLNEIIHCSPKAYFAYMDKSKAKVNDTYRTKWNHAMQTYTGSLYQQTQQMSWSEEKCAASVFKKIHGESELHLGNSKPVRHAANYPFFIETEVQVWSNRGTSGIDGSLSTAAGHSIITSDKTHFLLLGDLSFLYDRNGLWNPYLKPNLKIIVINNGGGRIFEKLPGPAAQPELESYFVAAQQMTFEATAAQHGLAYFAVRSEEEFNEKWEAFVEESERVAMMEVIFV